MTPDELAEVVFSGEKFRRELNGIAVRSILADLTAIKSEVDLQPTDWNHALFSCSALTAANSEAAQEAALRIAQSCLADPEAHPSHRDAAAVLLERMGNLPAITLAERRDLIETQAWGRA